jgi:hypothetical protein
MGWFEQGETGHCHAQIVDIRQGLRGLRAPVSSRGIGDIFGLSGSRTGKHARENGWTGRDMQQHASVANFSHEAQRNCATTKDGS